MRRFLTLLLLALPIMATAQVEVPPTLTLELDKQEFALSEPITGTAVIEFAPGFHGYQNPPLESWMIPVEVSGDGLTSITYPKGTKATIAGTEALYYEHATRIPVVFSGFDEPGAQSLTVTFKYQQCDADLCFAPTSGTASANVNISASVTKPDPLTVQPREKPVTPKEDPVPQEDEPDEIDIELNPAPSTRMSWQSGTYGAGKNFAATLFIEFGQGLHAYQNPPTLDYLLPVTVSGDSFVSAKYPEGHMIDAAGIKAASYEGLIEIPIVFKAPDEPGKRTIELTIDYQQCNDTLCFTPNQVLASFEVEVVAGGGTVTPVVVVPVGTGIDRGSLKPNVNPEQDPEETATKKEYGSGFEGAVNKMLEEENYWLIIPTAILIGLLLCLTPCVFPMIPITVSFFSSQASDNKGSRIMLGGLFALGIAFTYGVVGGISAGVGNAVGALFTKPWFMISLAALLIALALSMFGLYEIKLPNFISKNLKGRSGPVGALIMGLLMGFAAAPCAGALVGAFAAKIAEMGSVPVGIAMFSTIGLGMGLPFMGLALASSKAASFIRSGGWLTTVKALIGFIVLYFAFDYLFQGFGMKADSLSTYLAWIAVYVGFALYLFFFDKSDVSKAVGRIKGVAGLALGLLAGMTFSDYSSLRQKLEFQKELEQSGVASRDGSIFDNLIKPDGTGIEWVKYTNENFQLAVESGRPIMIDGQAEWCVQCREIEEGVFNKPEALVALSKFALLVIDWSTGVDPAYEKMTRDRFNITGLPNIVFMEPGGKNEFTVKDIESVDHLKQLIKRAEGKL